MYVVDKVAYEEWLVSEQDKIYARFVQKKSIGKCPRVEKMRDFRKSRSPINTGYWYAKESKWVKKAWSKKTRMKLKKELFNEAYYNVYAKDYKTYGYITW